MAGPRANGVMAPMMLYGPMTGDAFRAYVQQVLVPELQPGDVVVLDNLAAHEVEGIRDAFHTAGASLLYLPPYSPYLNPIEQLFAKQRFCSRLWPVRRKQRSGSPLASCSIDSIRKSASDISATPAMAGQSENALMITCAASAPDSRKSPP